MVSPYAGPGRLSRHSLLYWTFGDYLGLGAGAHAKLSFADGRIERRAKRRNPGLYMAHAATAARLESSATIARAELPFEFMLNALRLNEGVVADSFRRSAYRAKLLVSRMRCAPTCSTASC